MKSSRLMVCWLLLFTLLLLRSAIAAETLKQLVEGAKKEPELTFIAGAQTFGGLKTLNLLEAAFNRRFGLNMKIRFAAGPEMNSMAARTITELKSGAKPSSDIYHGSQSHVALLHKEKALEQVNYAALFPWITKPMEIFPNEGVLIFTSLRGIIYNSKLIAKDKAPKSYEDLVDPKLSPTWAGKMAIPPYVSWLVELSMIWSEDKVKDFTKKLVALSAGRLRYSEEERVVSGEFPIAITYVKYAYIHGSKGAPVDYVRDPKLIGDASYITLANKAPHPNAGKAFIDYFLDNESMNMMSKLGEFVNRKGILPPLPGIDKIGFVEMNDLSTKEFAEKKNEYEKIFLR